MKTKLKLLMAAGLMAATLNVANAKAAEMISIADTNKDFGDWITMTFEKGKFKASFPSEPDKQIKSLAGGIELVIYTANSGSLSTFAAGHTDLPFSLYHDELAGGFFEGMVQEMQGKIVSRTTRKKNGRKYYEIEFTGKINGKCRVVFNGRRLYYMTVVTLNDKIDDEEIKHFFNSLKII